MPPSEEGIDETLDALDGLLFSGGSDIDPAQYGHDAHPETTGIRAERDRGELALLRAALERDMPVLAVCRGSQVLNVARGGDLVQHLPETSATRSTSTTPGVFADHEVDVKAESRLGSLLGERAPVQVAPPSGLRPGRRGLVESAWAEDGTLEAVEDPGKRFAVGVLWHPEEGEDGALFRALVDEARRHEATRARRRRERRCQRGFASAARRAAPRASDAAPRRRPAADAMPTGRRGGDAETMALYAGCGTGCAGSSLLLRSSTGESGRAKRLDGTRRAERAVRWGAWDVPAAVEPLAGCCSWIGCGATGGSGTGCGCRTGCWTGGKSAGRATGLARAARHRPGRDGDGARLETNGAGLSGTGASWRCWRRAGARRAGDWRVCRRLAGADRRARRRRRQHGRRGGDEQLRHPRVVLGDALLELELQARLLGHPVVHLRPGVADHVADHDADDEAAEDRGEAVAARDRPGEAERAEGHRADEDARRRADRDAEPPDRTCLCLVVPDELFDCFL